MQTHKQVIENFVREGKAGMGTYVKATDDLLYSRVPAVYRPFGQEPWGETAAGQKAPLAVRLEDGSLLANGARLPRPMDNHQWDVLKTSNKTTAGLGWCLSTRLQLPGRTAQSTIGTARLSASRLSRRKSPSLSRAAGSVGGKLGTGMKMASNTFGKFIRWEIR